MGNVEPCCSKDREINEEYNLKGQLKAWERDENYESLFFFFTFFKNLIDSNSSESQVFR